MAREKRKKPQIKRTTKTKQKLKSARADVRPDTPCSQESCVTQAEDATRDVTVMESDCQDSTARPIGFVTEFVAERENPTTSTGDRADFLLATTSAEPTASTSTWTCDDTVATAYDGDEACSTGALHRATTSVTERTDDDGPSWTGTDRTTADGTTGVPLGHVMNHEALQRALDARLGDRPWSRGRDRPRSRGRVRPRSRDRTRSRSRDRSRSRSRDRDRPKSRGRNRARSGWPRWSRRLWSRFSYETHTCVVPADAFRADRRPRSTASGCGGRSSAAVRDGAPPCARLVESDPPPFEASAWRTADGAWSVRLQWTDRDGDDGTGAGTGTGAGAAADGERSFEVYARRRGRGDGRWRFLCHVDTCWPSVCLHVRGLPVGSAYQLCVRRVGGRWPLGVVRTEVLTASS